jgi:peptidoglycan/LPS O-acetylase OafA/YrhL
MNEIGYVEKTRIPALTGLRAIAAYLVFFHHFVPSPSHVGNTGFYLFAQGYSGVTLFFVLSGFLITHSYFNTKTWSARSFLLYFRNRFARVYPLYFIVCVASLISVRDFSVFTWFVNLSLLKGFSESWKFSNVAQAWSLTVEECFYALAPLIFYFVKKRKFAFLQLLVGFYSIALILLMVGKNLNWNGFFSSAEFIGGYTFFGRCFEFLLGVYASIWVQKHSGKSPWLKSGILTYLGVFSALFSTAVLGAIARKHNIWFGILTTKGLLFNNWVLPISFTLLISGLAVEKTKIAKILASRPLMFLGKSSYAFYLLHVSKPASLLGIEGVGQYSWFVKINVISGLAFLLLEDPISRFIRRQKNPFKELSETKTGMIEFFQRFYLKLKRNNRIPTVETG